MHEHDNRLNNRAGNVDSTKQKSQSGDAFISRLRFIVITAMLYYRYPYTANGWMDDPHPFSR